VPVRKQRRGDRHVSGYQREPVGKGERGSRPGEDGRPQRVVR